MGGADVQLPGDCFKKGPWCYPPLLGSTYLSGGLHNSVVPPLGLMAACAGYLRPLVEGGGGVR